MANFTGGDYVPTEQFLLRDPLPEWHEVSDRYDHEDVINLKAIAELDGAPGYDALRSYATGRREHSLLGPMPAPVCRIVNRRLWLKADVAAWLHCPIPAWRRTKQVVARWIADGRPRPTMPSDHGPGTPTPERGHSTSRAHALDAQAPG